VLSAPGGREALEFAGEGRIDLLLTDVVMPRMHGPELYESLHRRFPAMRVLYVSGYTGGRLDPHQRALPESAFLQKPFSLEALTTTVERLLGS
jgi:YesN/AraC family two-component response regulator